MTLLQPLSVMENSDPYLESLRVVWHDPTSYDPTRHAPPYMPSGVRLASTQKGSVRKFSATQVNPQVVQRLVTGSGMVQMSVLLAVLRAVAFLHQTHHWQARGSQSFSDHLLFERLYGESLGPIDQVAERLVGTSGEEGQATVDPVKQSQHIANLLAYLTSPTTDEDALVLSSLRAESLVVLTIDIVVNRMKAAGTLTTGQENLLQGVADLHETFVYLLRQRSGKSVGYRYER